MPYPFVDVRDHGVPVPGKAKPQAPEGLERDASEGVEFHAFGVW
jgi:hypothetical protein